MSEKIIEFKSFFEKAKVRERKPTGTADILIPKLPAYGRSFPRVTVKINPAEASGNSPREELMISPSELREFKSPSPSLAE